MLLASVCRVLNNIDSKFASLKKLVSFQQFTHISENVSDALVFLFDIVLEIVAKPVKGEEMTETLNSWCQQLKLPKVRFCELKAYRYKLCQIRGDKLMETYKEHHGPSNIPQQEMYKLHTEMDATMDVEELLQYSDRLRFSLYHVTELTSYTGRSSETS